MSNNKEITVWTTAVPLYFELVAVSSINIMDVFFMSLISDKAVAALGASTQVLLVFTLLIRTLTGGAGAIAAQYIGAKNRVNTLLSFMYSMAIAAVFGLLFAAFLTLSQGHIGLWMGLSGDTLSMSQAYLSIVGPAFLLLALRTGYTTIVAVKGKSKLNLLCALLANIVNIVFNCLFVLGWLGAPKLGVHGVALATTLSYVVYLVLIAVITHNRLHVRFTFTKRTMQKLHALSGPVLRIAIPNCGDLLSYSLFQVAILVIVIQVGDLAVAAHTYAYQAMTFIIIWSYSLAQGQSIWTAHLVGAGRYQEAQKQISLTIVRCAAVSVPAVVALYAGSSYIFTFFTNNPHVLAMISSAMLAYIGIEIGRAFNATLSFSLAAAGDARYPAVLGLLFNWGLGIPLALLFVFFFKWGLLGALLGVAIDELLRSPFNYWRLKSGLWMRTSSTQN